MADVKLYHATLDSNLESIAEKGICLNRDKADREQKSLTDLFNHVFNQAYQRYLPERIKLAGPIDRNEAIFLSAFADEYRKTEHPMVKGEHAEGDDVVYECMFDHDLSAFDAAIFEEWGDLLKTLLEFSPIVKLYLEQSREQKTAFSKLIKYFISGDFGVLDSDERDKDIFEEVRKEVISLAERAVEEYCRNAVNASDVVSRYGFFEEDGSMMWGLKEDAEGFPPAIRRLEILCNHDITGDYSLFRKTRDGIDIYYQELPDNKCQFHLWFF